MENGYLLKMKIFKIIFLSFTFSSSFAQFQERINIQLFTGYASFSTSNPEYEYYEEFEEEQKSTSSAKGFGIFPKVFNNPHYRIGYIYQSEDYSEWDLSSNIKNQTNRINKKVKIKSNIIEFNYLPFLRSSWEPYFLIGINYYYLNNVQSSRNIQLTDDRIVTNTSNIDSVSAMLGWAEPKINSTFMSVGFRIGGGLNYKLKEKIYLLSRIQYNYFYQNKSDYFAPSSHNYNVQLGIGFKFYKTKALF